MDPSMDFCFTRLGFPGGPSSIDVHITIQHERYHAGSEDRLGDGAS
jgi:hypothetical protein